MKKLYEKSPLGFALGLIFLYCFLQSLAGSLRALTGAGDLAPAVMNLLLSGLLLRFLRREGLTARYGLCKSRSPARAFLWYIPLLLLGSGNLWYGAAFSRPGAELLFAVGNMLCAGFLEELLFRGFLFKALEKNGVRLAAVLSSVTFGLGHILNLLNGGMGLMEGLCQICCAAAIGFLFVTVFSRGGSLLPCIATHCAIDVTSVFAGDNLPSGKGLLLHSAFLLAVSVVYTLILFRTLPDRGREK